jgi:1-phosphofructokinase family hexose kinase
MIEALKEKLRYRIITVTLCPVFDKTVWIKNFKAGDTFLLDDSKIIAAGKGVNVSRALRAFDISSIATGMLPDIGAPEYIRLLEEEDISHDFLFTSGSIRTNTTIIGGKGSETHLRERGSRIPASAFVSFKKKILNLIKKDTVFVFSGRLAEGLADKSYFDLISTVKEQGCLVFLDVSGAALKRALKAKPYFIKPNLREVQDALGYFPATIRDLLRAINYFHNLGIEHVVISRGKDGVLYSEGREIVSAKCVISNPVNSVGSGDAAVAGCVIGILSGIDNRKIAKLAAAFGGANTLLSGAGRLHPQDVMQLYKNVEMSPVS